MTERTEDQFGTAEVHHAENASRRQTDQSGSRGPGLHAERAGSGLAGCSRRCKPRAENGKRREEHQKPIVSHLAYLSSGSQSIFGGFTCQSPVFL